MPAESLDLIAIDYATPGEWSVEPPGDALAAIASGNDSYIQWSNTSLGSDSDVALIEVSAPSAIPLTASVTVRASADYGSPTPAMSLRLRDASNQIIFQATSLSIQATPNAPEYELERVNPLITPDLNGNWTFEIEVFHDDFEGTVKIYYVTNLDVSTADGPTCQIYVPVSDLSGDWTDEEVEFGDTHTSINSRNLSTYAETPLYPNGEGIAEGQWGLGNLASASAVHEAVLRVAVSSSHGVEWIQAQVNVTSSGAVWVSDLVGEFIDSTPKIVELPLTFITAQEYTLPGDIDVLLTIQGTEFGQWFRLHWLELQVCGQDNPGGQSAAGAAMLLMMCGV